jgi:rhamnosyl/mannosyltransferase
LVREVRTIEADVLHVHLPNPIGELGVALNRRVPILCSFHAQLGRQKALEPLYAPLRKLLFDRSSSILVSGDKMASAGELQGYREKVRTLPYGISPRMIGPSRSNERPPEGPLRILFVGRLVYYKGVDVLLRSLVDVPDATLRIVGDGADRQELEELAMSLGIAPRTTFIGVVSDIDLVAEYSKANLFVLPSVSRAEAFGMAMTEAMANGLPAISTSLGTGTDWVNIDGQTGIVVAPGDIQALAEGIERMREPRLREFLSQGAVERTRSLFSFEHHADQLEAAYLEAAT